MLDASHPTERTCFVTIGATASFPALLTTVLSTSFVQLLHKHGYAHLRVQYGDDVGKTLFTSFLEEYGRQFYAKPMKAINNGESGEDATVGHSTADPGHALITFDYKDINLNEQFDEKLQISIREVTAPLPKFKVSGFSYNPSLAAELANTRSGITICHGGAGTILDGLRVGAPLIVVPNASLMDNHQVELAEELGRQGLVVVGNLEDMEKSLIRGERLRRKMDSFGLGAGVAGGEMAKFGGEGIRDVVQQEIRVLEEDEARMMEG